ncbi:MAG: glycosyltransferase family 39 protein [Candidatus Lernaella stagnicola]|nr:glycosyltransferase family 39 protein [Candidatus Lernaella stagnicola]
MTSETASPPRAYAEKVAFAAIGVGLLVRLLIAIQPAVSLVPICLADDTFYYLRIAENILAGHGASFDGVVATNGYHPLWMLVSMAAVALTGEAVAASRVLLVLLALIGAGNALLFWRLMRDSLGPLPALWAACVWSLSPYLLFTEMMGVEAPLMMLGALAALNVYHGMRAQEPSRRQWLLLGGLLGLTLLARTDAVLLAVLLALDAAVIHWWRRRGDAPALRRQIGFALAGAGVAALVVAPWVVYNLAAFGSITQDSARALLFRERTWWELGGASLGTHLSQALPAGFGDYFLRLIGWPNASLALAFVTLLVGGGVAARLAGGERFFRAEARPSLLIIGWGIVVWAFYILYFWQQKFWYFLPLHAGIGAAGALVIAYLQRVSRDACVARRWFVALLALMIASYGYVGLKIWQGGFQPWQSSYVRAAQAVRDLHQADPTLRFAAFNAGIISAWSRVPVVNLDGVVNPDVIRAQRDRALLAYLRERGIDYVIDHQKLIAASGAFAEPEWPQAFTLSDRFPASKMLGDLLVLKLKPAP